LNTTALNNLNRNDYRAANDWLPHQCQKCKDLGGDYVEYRTCGVTFFSTVYIGLKLWNILISYRKLLKTGMYKPSHPNSSELLHNEELQDFYSHRTLLA
jgi:hypothetical protein